MNFTAWWGTLSPSTLSPSTLWPPGLAQGPAPTQWGPVWYIAITLLLALLGAASALWKREANRADRLEVENQRLQQTAVNRLEAAVVELKAAKQEARVLREDRPYEQRRRR